MTHSSTLVNYATTGVSAGPNAPDTGLTGPDPSVDPLTNDVEPVKVCFPAGTVIYLGDGTCKTVEQIAETNRLTSVSDRSPEGPISMGEVVEVIRNGASDLVAVEFGGRVVRATPRHPFYVIGRGFIPAEELAPGDQLRTRERRADGCHFRLSRRPRRARLQLPGPRPAHLLHWRCRRNCGAGA